METGDKIPLAENNGNKIDVFYPGSSGAELGNISWNIRMSMAFAEMMNFYVIITSISIIENKFLI